MAKSPKQTGLQCLFIAILTTVTCAVYADDFQVYKQPIVGSSFYKVDPDKVKLERSCSVYVPAYSHVYLTESQTAALGITLSIRNIDSKQKLYITQVEYYDTQGKLTDTLNSGLFALEPMATASYVIAQHDMRGGVGANFIVRWAGEKQIHPPITEAVMVGNVGTKGYSFSSRGENIFCSE